MKMQAGAALLWPLAVLATTRGRFNHEGPSDHPWCHNASRLSAELLVKEKAQYWREGYIVVRQLFTPAEMAIVKSVVMNSHEMNRQVKDVRKRQLLGEHPSFSTIKVWNDVDGTDIFAKVGKSDKILDRLSCFYNDDVYDYHNKIALKYPGIAGFRAHQDHNYWQMFGSKYSDANAVFIAIDDATEENGCLQVVPQSHLLGLLPHNSHKGYNGSTDTGLCIEEMERLKKVGCARAANRPRARMRRESGRRMSLRLYSPRRPSPGPHTAHAPT